MTRQQINTDKIFNKYFQMLVAYKRVHGHCYLPANSKAHSINTWVNQQRLFYRKKLLSLEHIKQLEKLGIRWKIYLHKGSYFQD